MPKIVDILILNYQGTYHLKNCLNTIFETGLDNQLFDVYVIDNNSPDESVKIAEQYLPNKSNLKIIKLSENLGYAGAYNYILKHTTSKYAVLVNNDVIFTKNWLKPLIKLMENHNNIGALAPLIYYYKTKIPYFSPSKLLYGGIIKTYPFSSNVMSTDYSTGTVLCLRRESLCKSGLFDNDYFMYFEETDLCFRIAKNSYNIVCTSDSYVYHNISKSRASKNEVFRTNRNRVLFCWKNYKHKKIYFLTEVLGLGPLWFSIILIYQKQFLKYKLEIFKGYKAALKLILQKRINKPDQLRCK